VKEVGKQEAECIKGAAEKTKKESEVESMRKIHVKALEA
jgi:hypothetical protein